VRFLPEEERVYLLYDERAIVGSSRYDVDYAIVSTTSETLQEATEDKEVLFPEGVILSYLRDAEGYLTDERMEE